MTTDSSQLLQPGAPTQSLLPDPASWKLPLAEHMAGFARIREEGAFVPGDYQKPLSGTTDRF